MHKNTEAEALTIILQLLPKNFSIEHVKSHQDDKVAYNELDTKAQLNIDADSIATATASIPINTHAISLPFAMYINNQYTHHRPDHSIRIASHQHEAHTFLKNKYRWSSKVFHSINWDSHGSCLLTLNDSLKRFSLRFIHHRLPTGKMLFTYPNSCPYCKSPFTPSSPHDHFLTCSNSSLDKETRLNSIQKTLSTLHTPPLLQQHILLSLSKVYNINLSPSKYSPPPSIYASSEIY